MSDSMLNKSSVRNYALKVAGDTRAGQIERIGKDYFDRLDARVRNLIREDVHKHPSRFKTLK